jgi:hypothetical protein
MCKTTKTPIELFEEVNLDYTNLTIELLDMADFDFYNFQITPREYLKFAKDDLKEKSDKSIINALSNAKRAIDCLIESTLKGLSLDIDNGISKQAMTFCNIILNEENKDITPNILKLFTALGLAPSFLISEVRLLRNKIEHNYELPKKEDVIKAIEVADLLINNIESKRLHCYELLISDEKNGKKGILFNITYDSKTINTYMLISGEIPDEHRFLRKSYYNFKGNELIYYYLLRAMIIARDDEYEFKEVIKLFICEVAPSQPKEYIKSKIIY